MLYTIGFKQNYDASLAEGPYRKLGKGKDHKGNPYAGGAVFETQIDARRYLQNHNLIGYDVYGLDTTVENTHQVDGEAHLRLVQNCDIVKLS